MTFMLHSKLAEDCKIIGDMPLCRVLLMNNRIFPWLILVPKREGMRELFDLPETDYNMVMEEVRNTASKFSNLVNADKINIACLGNVVEQLHIHIIARYKNDPAWPQPVWNSTVPPQHYSIEEMAAHIEKFRSIIDI